jgi:hypothetical protein
MAIYELELEDGSKYQIETEDDQSSSPTHPTPEAPQLSTGLRAMTGSMSPVPPMPLPKEAQVPYTTSEQAGGMLAEKAVEAGLSPTLGAALYTGPQMAKDLMQAEVIGVPVAKGVGKVVSGIKGLASGVSKVSPEIPEAITNIEKDLGQLTVRKAGLKSRMISARKAAEEELGKVKQGIQGYESSAGLSPKEVTQLPADFDKVAAKLASMSPKDLSTAAPLETLQEWNKTASLARRTADPASRIIYDKVKTVTTEAQDLLKPGIKGLRESFSTAKKGIEAIPSTFKAEEASLAEQIARKQLSLKEAKAMLPKTSNKESFVKKVLKLGLQSAVGGTAAGAAWNLFK